jgi:anti-anti-sigma factor
MISVEKEDITLYIKIKTKSFDSISCKTIRDEFDLLNLDAIENVIVDLEGVAFLDSSGISALLYLHKKNKGHIVIHNAREHIVHVIEMLGLHRIFELM